MSYHLQNSDIVPAEVKEIMNYYFGRLNYFGLTCIRQFYLMGSVGTGDYMEGRSDIDFCAVTNELLDQEEVKRLTEIHKEIKHRFRAPMSGAYIRRKLLYEEKQDDIRCYIVSSGTMHEGTRPALHAYYLTMLLERSVMAYGAKENIACDHNTALRELYGHQRKVWEQWVCDHEWPKIKSLSLMLRPSQTLFIIMQIGMCYSLSYNTRLLSKTAVGELLAQDFGEYRYAVDVVRKSRIPPGTLPALSFSAGRYVHTIELAKAMLAKLDKIYHTV